jgi:hypothetical protein
MHACRLNADAAVRAGVISRPKWADDELSRSHSGDRGTDSLDDAAVFVSERLGFGDRVDAAVVPEIGVADAGRSGADDGIGRFDDGGFGELFQAYVALAVNYCTAHEFSFAANRCFRRAPASPLPWLTLLGASRRRTRGG